MTDTNSARSADIESIKKAIDLLKQGGSKLNLVSASYIQELKALADKYPNDPSRPNFNELVKSENHS